MQQKGQSRRRIHIDTVIFVARIAAAPVLVQKYCACEKCYPVL